MESASSPNESPFDADANEAATFRVSTRPVIESHGARDAQNDAPALPRTYGTQTLCLMARDPHTIFAYWDIDWSKAFREGAPRGRKVHLRLLRDDGAEQASVEVEPMAGNCYVTVPNADSSYSGEIGYFGAADEWTSLATSELVTTPPDSLNEIAEPDFATVPFHLAFQHMIDLLRISKQENESLTAMLSQLRTRAAAPNENNAFSAEQRELVDAIETAVATAPQPAASIWPNERWRQQQLERILGFGTSSPTSGFGGGS